MIDSRELRAVDRPWRARLGSASDSVHAVLGGLVGGLVAAVLVAAFTSLIKDLLAWVMRQDGWIMMALPFLGIIGAVLLLNLVAGGRAAQRVGAGEAPPRRFSAWLRFPANAVRADLTADVVRYAGREEAFPVRLAPIRALAIISTVGLGAPMGTESPAAHLGVAAGAMVGRGGGVLRRIARPAGVGGGAAAVAVLLGLPLVGLFFMLELGRRRQAVISLPRALAAATGAFVGWGVNAYAGLDLIVLSVPHVPPGGLPQALGIALLAGALAGVLSSATGSAIYQARSWKAGPVKKLAVGGAALLACVLAISAIAAPAAAIGPGMSTVGWAEAANASIGVLLFVAALRALATTAAVMAGGCGGLFVPLLAIGDLCGRAIAPVLGAPADLGAAAGAVSAVAGGYRLPLTAIAMALTLGGPVSSRLTCAAAVLCATAAAVPVAYLLDRYVLHHGKPVAQAASTS